MNDMMQNIGFQMKNMGLQIWNIGMEIFNIGNQIMMINQNQNMGNMFDPNLLMIFQMMNQNMEKMNQIDN